MLDNALFTAVRSVLVAGLAAREITAEVVRNFPKTVQGVNIGPTLYFVKGDEKRYGWPQKTDVLNQEGTEYVHTERQFYETPVKITGSVEETPGDLEQLTASDLANSAASILQCDDGTAALAEAGLSVLRVGQVRNGKFVNGEGQFEILPNFEIVILHEQVTVTTTPVAQIKALRVVDV